jgi:hypothetical protein
MPERKSTPGPRPSRGGGCYLQRESRGDKQEGLGRSIRTMQSRPKLLAQLHALVLAVSPLRDLETAGYSINFVSHVARFLTSNTYRGAISTGCPGRFMGICVPKSGIFLSGCPPFVCSGVQTGPSATSAVQRKRSLDCCRDRQGVGALLGAQPLLSAPRRSGNGRF